MKKIVGIGHQDFERVITRNIFYIDKTMFIKEWWESEDIVTLITRPRRFGKTLNLSMTGQFFSCQYAGKGALFEGLSVWEEEAYRKLQGTYPVIALSFSDVKETTFEQAKKKICGLIRLLYNEFHFLVESDVLNDSEKADFHAVSANMENYRASLSLKMLSGYLYRYYRKRAIILLDEYDTPMQEAYVHGYWNEMADFVRGLFNSTFKANPYLERALMTGITRVSKESIFSDLNHIKVVTATSAKYACSFGFTEDEVFHALDEFGLSDKKQDVKKWYDGFTFGNHTDIYNPWSIINYLNERELGLYWVNTSSNSLAGKLIREGSRDIKRIFEDLLNGGTLTTEIDEQIIYDQLGQDEQTIWALLLASGYLKVSHYEVFQSKHTLELTNLEVKVMFQRLIRGWFGSVAAEYNGFMQAMLQDDLKVMNIYMNKVSMQMFSYFDTGNKPSREEPERFYHGFVLGLMADLADRYYITSNRESGFGRYDVMLEPRVPEHDDAIILEFKVQDDKEKELADTVQAALDQIQNKNYETVLIAKGILKERIRKYGFAFQGKKVLIDSNRQSGEEDAASIRTFIENGKEFGVTEEKLIQKLMDKFHLGQAEAEARVKKYF